MANQAECAAAGIDPKAVDSIARRLVRVCRDAEKLGISVFFGSGCSLRADDGSDRKLILEVMNIPNADGGDGAENPGADGLMRSE